MNTNTRNTLRMTLVALAATSATMLAGVTHAAGAGDSLPSVAVTYTDLNLNSNAGIQVLYRRIQHAADTVCGIVDARNLPGMIVKKACVERAVSKAVAAVHSPLLTRVYFEHSGNSGTLSLPIAQVR